MIDCISQNSAYHKSSSLYPCIPVMGVPVLLDPVGFLGRLISSVDFCVDHFVVVVSKALPQSMIENISSQHKYIRNLQISRSDNYLIGVAEGWNKVLKSHPSAPWYLICGYDVEFLPGQLRGLSFRFWNHSNSHIVPSNSKKTVFANFAHTRWQNLPGGKGYGLFAISQEVIQNVGYFDENIFPAFWEDRDWKMRMSLWPGSRVRTYRNIRPWHGVHDPKIVEMKYISGTKYLPDAWREISHSATEFNREYVVRKWGCNPALSISRYDLLECKYKRPFGDKNSSISFWIKDENRINWIRKRNFFTVSFFLLEVAVISLAQNITLIMFIAVAHAMAHDGP
eukprot:gene11097-23198_t